jgi:RecB family exonuclease
MATFLNQLAQRIIHEHPMDADKVLVVFNNNRSKRFFTKEFETIGRNMFLPQVQSIDELIADLGGLEIVQNEFLLFELYDLHVDIGGEERKYKTFEDFISFGDLMMSDFSQIDQYCVDASRIFDNLHQLKAIGEWDIEGTALTGFQKQYLEFYRSLYQYYTRLHERLLSQRKAYSGMAYREVADHIEALTEGCPWKTVFFVGFNALSRCEELIIGEYVKRGIGHVVTDADPYYMEPLQEAGHFLRKHGGDFPEMLPKGPSCFALEGKRITVVECPENVLQCKYAGQLIESHPEWTEGGEAERTAVVLADESLLVPMLNALPDTPYRYNINVSMGFAYADSMMHALVGKLFALYRQQNGSGYYHSDVVEVLSDRIISQIAGAKGLRRVAEGYLRRGNRIRCTEDDIKEILHLAKAEEGERIAFLFEGEKPTPGQCLARLRQLATEITNSDLTDTNPKERQALGSLVEVTDNLEALHASHPYITNIETLERIYTRLAARHSIALIGEPLKGLQLMGMLETRNLDFKRVVLLSAGEGILPAGRSENTLIPYELQRHFGLPTYVEKDAVFAYHFYHLLQRAEEVYLVYSSESNAMGKGEPSRYIRQVETELAPRYGIELIHDAVWADTQRTAPKPTTPAPKSEKVMQQIEEMAQRGLSPTSFCDYVECPLKYYYARVLGVSERDTMEEDIDASQLGDAIHKVLENIYRPLTGKPVPIAALQEARQHLPELMEQAFADLYSSGRNTEGRNRFLYQVAESQLRHMLQNEENLLKEGHSLTVIAVEATVEKVKVGKVNIKGKIDRVDKMDGMLRIVDYKTGSLDKKEIAYADDGTPPAKWLQLMWYALLYSKSAATVPAQLQAGIYPLRHLRSGVKTATWNGIADITPEMLANFEALLTERTDELMDATVPFAPTPSRQGCRFCPARNFCTEAME